jgi:hypothetical protein
VVDSSDLNSSSHHHRNITEYVSHHHHHSEKNSTILPTLFFIGASKCATSSIAAALSRHPNIINIAHGEAHYFDKEPFPLVHTYQHLLAATKAAKMNAGTHHHNNRGQLINTTSTSAVLLENPIMMEYTPHYLFESKAPMRICETLQLGYHSCREANYIVFIREPVARTLSSWEYKQINGGEDRSLKHVVREGEEFAKRMLKCWHKYERVADALHNCSIETLLTPPPHDHASRMSRSHVGKSLYFYQLAHWFAYIPKKNFLIMQFEVYYSDPSKYFAQLLEFGGVEPFGKHGFQTPELLHEAAVLHINSKHDAKLQEQITDFIKEKLAEIFKPHNALLDELLGYKTGY